MDTIQTFVKAERKELRLNQEELVGYLIEGDNGYSFTYSDDYLMASDAKPLSLTLPLSKNKYHSNVLFPFFDGLVPEGWLLDIGERHWKLNSRDRFASTI